MLQKKIKESQICNINRDRMKSYTNGPVKTQTNQLNNKTNNQTKWRNFVSIPTLCSLFRSLTFLDLDRHEVLTQMLEIVYVGFWVV